MSQCTRGLPARFAKEANEAFCSALAEGKLRMIGFQWNLPIRQKIFSDLPAEEHMETEPRQERAGSLPRLT